MKIKICFDFSDYPQDSKFLDPANKKDSDKMKDEFNGKIVSKFIGLKSKIYSFIAIDGEEIKKVKRVNKNLVKNIRRTEYIDVLFNKKMIRNKMKRIQSKLHRTGT